MSKMQHWFTQTFTYKRLVSNSSWSDEPVSVTGAFKGFIQPVSGSTSLSNQKQTFTLSHTIYTLPSTLVKPEDVVVYNGKKYIVRDIQFEGISGINDHQEIGVEFLDANPS